MKAILIYSPADDSYIIHAHNLEDTEADITTLQLINKGKQAYSFIQTSSHGGEARTCPTCKNGAASFLAKQQPHASARQALDIAGLREEFGMLSSRQSTSNAAGKIGGISGKVVKIIIPVVALLILAVIGILLFRGPGKPFYAAFIHSLTLSSATQPAPTLPVIVNTEVIAVKSSFTSTPVIITPSPSPTVSPSPSSTPFPPTPQPTPTAGCMPVLAVSVKDVGKTLCVTGKVLNTFSKKGATYIAFSGDRGSFYMVLYDLQWPEAQAGVCIQATGEIKQLGDAPIMVLGYNNKLGLCP